jgi:hypothetical protein
VEERGGQVGRRGGGDDSSSGGHRVDLITLIFCTIKNALILGVHFNIPLYVLHFANHSGI